MRYSARINLINAIWFQLFWFIAVLMQNDGIVVLTALLIAHCIWQRLTRPDLLFVAVVCGWGALVDTLLIHFNVYQFATDTTLIPAWLLLLWAAFAITLRFSLSLLFSFPRIAPLLGGIGGSLSTYGAMKLGAVSFTPPLVLALSLFFCIWAGHLFLFALLNEKLSLLVKKQAL